MIKHQSYAFSELDVPDHWVNFASFGTMLDTKQEYFEDYRESSLKLRPGEVYQMALDQSSSNTGIFIKNITNTEAHMVEVLRPKGQNASDYTWDLEMFLHSFSENCTFSHLLYERPINTEAYRSAQVLFQLEGVICSLPRRYPEFKTAILDNIENSSWRAAVCDKSLEKMYDRKTLSRVSVNNLWPWTREYGFSLYKDNDVFEAIGVMMGWFYNSFDPLGRPYVRGDRTTRTIGGYILPGVGGEQAKKLLEDQGIPSTFYVENPKYSIYKNLAAGVRAYKTICVELTTKYTMLCMCIECNIKWLDPEVMTVILVDASTVDRRLDAIAGGSFHFVL